MTDTFARTTDSIVEGPIPPQALEAERSVLAALLLDAEAVGRAAELIEPAVFYRVAHQKIFQAMMALFNRNEKIDLITLSEELRKQGELEAVGGPAALSQILEYAATSANLEQHSRIIHGKAVLRLLIKAASEIQQECYAAADETPMILDRAEQRIFQITDQRVRQGFISMKELMMPTMKHIEELSERKAFVTGVPSGFEDLDKLTAGFQRSDLVIIAGRPAMGKCLAKESELVLDDGEVVTIEQVFHRRDSRVGTLRADFKLDRAAPSEYVDDGFKPVFQVTTRLGRRVETTLTHPFLTFQGWRPLSELSVGDYVAVPRVLPVFGNDSMRECEIKLLAYLIGDGSLTGSSPTFTTTNEVIERDFIEAVDEFGGCVSKPRRSAMRAPSFAVVADVVEIAAARSEFAASIDAAVTQSGRTARAVAQTAGVSPASLTHWRQGKTVPDPERFGRLCRTLEVEPDELALGGAWPARHNAPNALTRWLRDLGLAGKGAGAKEIPAPVFRLPRPQLAMFLRHLFATDGWATVLASGQPQVGYSTISERLARQVSHLLLRFGVIAKLRQRWVKYKDARRPSWQLDITDAPSIRRFIAEVGIFGKEAAVTNVRHALDSRREHSNVDRIPIEVWDELERAKGTLSWAELARSAGVSGSNIHVRKRALSPRRLARFAGVLGHTRLAAISGGDVYWDRVESIVPVGIKQVYDLTIPETHNFVANDVCVHNTSFALNLAENAAILHQKNVAILSLEMSKEQLVLRMLCSQAEVPLFKVRSGRLSESEFRRLVNLTGGLYKASIMIDDSAASTVLEIRAKCRRLRSENKLDLVVIDYLQLVRASGAAENRVQEISQITRALKALAKELDVPVIALSQLSRAVETRAGDRRPQLSDLRESGCLTADSRVLRADTGAAPTLGELLATGARAIPVWTVDHDLRLVRGTMTHVFTSGTKPVFELALASGRRLEASANHPFLTPEGWRPLAELEAGGWLAVVRGPEPGSESRRARLAAPRATGPRAEPTKGAQGAALALEEPAALPAAPGPGVFWDRITCIRPMGEKPVFDATVPGTHNFVANGIVAHNSIEQDADLVLFVYREEMYKKEDPTLKGKADIIVAKQRNGPTGDVKLTFLHDFTRFVPYSPIMPGETEPEF